MSPDPLTGSISNPQSLNRYAYVMNNPTTLTDPSGLCGNAGQQPCASPGPCSAQNWMPICTSGLQYGAAPPGSYDEFDTLENSTGTAPGQMIGDETIKGPWGSTSSIFGLTVDLGLPVSGPQSFSWWGAFATSFVTNFPKTTWNSITNSNGCLNLFSHTVINDFNPIPSEPTPTDFVESATRAYAASKLYTAFGYGYSSGLTTPLRSSTFRQLLQETDVVGAETALEATPQIFFVGALLHGVITEGAAALNGECE